MSKKNKNEKNVRNKAGNVGARDDVRGRAEAEEKETGLEKNLKAGKNRYAVMSYVIGVVAVLLLVLFIADWTGSDAWFTIFTRFLKGLFSFASFGTPFILIYCAYFLPKIARERKHFWNLILAGTLILSVSVIAGLILNAGTVGNPIEEYAAGKKIDGGGIFGAYISFLFIKALSAVGAWILTIAITALQIIFLVGLTVTDAGALFLRLIKRAGRAIAGFFSMLIGKITGKKTPENKTSKKPGAAEEEDDETFVPPSLPGEDARYYHKPMTDENPYAGDDAIDPRASAREQKKGTGALQDPEDGSGYRGIPKPEVIERDPPEGWGNAGSGIGRTASAKQGSVQLEEIFRYDPDSKDGRTAKPRQEKGGDPVEPVVLPIGDGADDDETSEAVLGKTATLMTTAGKDEEVKVRTYVFPPVSLLNAVQTQKNDVSEELQTNAARLVEALRSFRVRTNVVNISRGPTITRYELQPEEGVRVRQIASLVDDISLQLAASGVRIEAPIPGKSAVGIEVPNKTRETVYLRTLIDNQTFEQSQAKLTAAVGVDVAGEPVYVDLAKMPHLLIAGTTGSGKSVCMNCLILSILYKATPDEVKMIMIDPKKVEFNVYNGLPHLIIPVVSNSKKAAGALSWAVSEMERRYEVIEQVGVRDLYSYNKATANDPEKEYMPQLVIIIDELADLMLTAPGEVEESICRIAAKGRACGMHLIIGTQRPSVDVITGLIKANVPSRIAFTVSSQVDSRTIIDIAGAEKLVGRGDMLFYPIGYMKPVRLQGAFVSDGEVEEVTNFIIDHSEEAVYDDQVMKDIEKEAELCGSKKKSGGAEIDTSSDDGESDPMLKSAIDLAVESGKISTSLIQRRLSLGYGRAAKLIDEMEKRGIVSPPEGQKPRTVLISASDWAEMRARSEE